MKIYVATDTPEPQLFLNADTVEEEEILENFARLKKPLIATIEHDRGYPFPYLVIKRSK